MARVHRVNKSAKEHTCSKDGAVIPKGDPYLWAKPGFRTRRPVVRCIHHPFKESDLITGNRAEIVRAIEDARETIESAESISDIETAMSDLESAADDYQSLRQEALDAWPNGNSGLEEWVYQAEAIVSEVGGWSANYSDSDEPDEDWLDEQHAQAEEAGDEHTREDLIQQWRDERLEEERESANDTIDSLDY